jgi:type II secretory pathway component GspD/PulD (secretin)
MLGGSVEIVPDDRLNVLVVEARPADLDTVEQLLRILDQPTSPEEVQVDAPPRLIPVYNTSASQIATVVQQVYQDRMRSTPGQQQQPSPEDIIRLLRGSRGEGGQNRDQQEAAKMSLGIDARSNSLVVRAPDPLFQEVKLLVETLDNAEMAMQEATQVVSVKSANSATVQRALAALYGGSVQTSSPPQGPQSGEAPSTAGPRGRQGDRQPDESARREFFEGIRRFQQFQQQFQQSPEGGGEGRGRRGGRP